MVEILQHPQSPDELARLAGQTIYDTPVGLLRRSELYRLGNAWNLKFPVGASKDYMLPFFKQLEAQGKNPLRPPVAGHLDQIVKAREVQHEGTAHSETIVEEEPTLAGSTIQEHEPFYKPDAVLDGPSVLYDVDGTVLVQYEPKSEFETKLEHLQMGEIRKLCKLRNIKQTPRDRKQDLIARIMAASEAPLEQDASSGC